MWVECFCRIRLLLLQQLHGGVAAVAALGAVLLSWQALLPLQQVADIFAAVASPGVFSFLVTFVQLFVF